MAGAPAICWSSGRLEFDLYLSRKLIAKLDAEKGISNNELLATGDKATADLNQEKAKDAKEEEAKEGQTADGKDANGSAGVKEDVKMEESAPAEDKKAEVEGTHHKA